MPSMSQAPPIPRGRTAINGSVAPLPPGERRNRVTGQSERMTEAIYGRI
jgi:hypothetical protein